MLINAGQANAATVRYLIHKTLSILFFSGHRTVSVSAFDSWNSGVKIPSNEWSWARKTFKLLLLLILQRFSRWWVPSFTRSYKWVHQWFFMFNCVLYLLFILANTVSCCKFDVGIKYQGNGHTMKLVNYLKSLIS